jgi:uncharacterized protein YigA (DUF484 family)
MTEQTEAGDKQDTLSESDVVAYLERHPDTLLRHPDLLRRLQVPHLSGQGAVSLIERQVDLLRDKNRELDERLLGLINNARFNEDISDKLHRYSIKLYAAGDLNMLLDTSPLTLQQLFDLDAAAIRLKPELATAAGLASDLVLPDKAYTALLDSLGSARCRCHTDLDDELLQAVFGSDSSGIRSVAMMALDTPHRVGLLALGSKQRDRFTPDMGNLFLERLGELMSAAVGRFHAD